MSIEFETKFFIDSKESIREKLLNVGAERTHEDFLMQRRTFHHRKKGEKSVWFRVRKEYSRITLTYKCIHTPDIDGIEELETEVSDFDVACEILTRAGLEITSFQENYRETWWHPLGEIMIDTWPGLDPYIEIEGLSPERVEKLAGLLGFAFEERFLGGTEFLYEKILGIPHEILIRLPTITFEDPPKCISE